MSSVRNLLCVTILAVLASTGYAIQCYQCNTFGIPEACKSNVSTLIDCSTVTPPAHLSKVGAATGCLKRIQKNPSMPRPETLYSCHFGDVNNKQGCQLPEELKPLRYSVLSCHVCTEDKCNGSASLSPIGGAIILFFGVVRLLATRLLEVSLTVFP
ncbi:uncharacterized protein LOC117565085 [Drosophila albomicans]|uniref:Uncharacterized protein LOC117565085 n=1 Tax=Drosophila albomicans TaxID=7291 RepID=A0A6P8W8G3_DROAB|nr:uncharacterized protein LOC117565085 [Drosophila albomicans]